MYKISVVPGVSIFIVKD